MIKQLLLPLFLLLAVSSYADRIYIVNSFGYTMAGSEIIAAMQANGHTVVNDPSGTFPATLTSRCIDPVNGFDWLCFFGENDYSVFTTQIKNYIDVGGKVFYQYEVDCCPTSSTAVAAIASSITGLSITPNFEAHIAFSGVGGGGWVANGVSCCADFQGDAYKGMDGLPTGNQLLATANIASSTPDISQSPAFGFYFATTNFTGPAHKGGFVGLGDVNTWYHGAEPGTTVDQNVINYFFPGASNACFLFPQGCLQTFAGSSGGAISGAVGSNSPICPGQQLNLTSGGPSGAIYSWTGPNGFTSNLQNPTIPNAQSVNAGTYTVTISESGCSTSLSVTVSIGSLSGSASGNSPLCPGDQLNLTATGPSGASFSWVGPNGFTSNLQNPTIANVQSADAGTYTVTVSNGTCSSSFNMNVVVNAAVSGTIGSNSPICPGQQLNLTSTGPAGATYSWTGPNGFTSNLQNPTISNAQSANEGTYNLTISSGGCSTSLSVSVVFGGTVNPVVSPAGPYCEGDAPVNLTVSITGGTWSGNGITNAVSGTFDPALAGAGTHTITYAITGACTGNDSQDIVVNAVPVVTTQDVATCPGAPVQLDASGADTYSWSPSAGLSSTTGSSVTATVNGPMTYTVTGTSNGCTASATTTISMNSAGIASANATPNPVSADDPTVVFTAGPPEASFLWILQDGNTSAEQSFQYTFEGSEGNQTVMLIATFPNGCMDTVRFKVYIEEELIFYVPNSFTPNNDGSNEVFQPVFTSGFDPNNYELLIFNRWGELIFQTTDVTKGWDGTYEGNMVQDGVYTWSINFKAKKSDKKYLYQGHVTKIK